MLRVLLPGVRAWITFLYNALLRSASNLIETIPLRDLTVTRIGITELWIGTHWKAHEYLPVHLADLPALNGRDHAMIDGWGKPIR